MQLLHKDNKACNSLGSIIESCCILDYRGVLFNTSSESKWAGLIIKHHRETYIGCVTIASHQDFHYIFVIAYLCVKDHLTYNGEHKIGKRAEMFLSC